jgi:formylglycine-generating enzyme required for sulfatase activity
MRNSAVLFFICLAISRVSFAEEVVGFCISSLKKLDKYAEVNKMAYFKVSKTVIEKYPQSALAQIVSGQMPAETHLVHEKTFYAERGQLEANCYILDSVFDPTVFEEILNWMATGDIERMKVKFPLETHLETLLNHADRLQLSELSKALRKTVVGRFVKIPGGKYEIGNFAHDNPSAFISPSDAFDSTYWVTLSEFEIGETAVTQESYVMGTGKMNPSKHQLLKHCPKNFKVFEVKDGITGVCVGYPVENVDWDDANEYARWESAHDLEYIYDLPTEAQLEVAFRGKTTTKYVSGDDPEGVDAFAWHKENSGGQTHPVKSKQPNSFGIYRSGVWEWARDWYDSWRPSDGFNPTGPATGDQRVKRGGSWADRRWSCRSCSRASGWPTSRDWVDGSTTGLRLVRKPRY